MPVYVTDPLNPNGPKIDVIELKRRDPTKDLEPFLIDEYLKQDLWSMKEAVLLLAGYDLKTDCTLNDNKFSPTGIGRVFYLDGLSSHQLNDNGLPDSLNDECFTAYLKLIEHTRHYDIHAEKKQTQDWIKWAIDKDLKPYWLDFVQGIIEHDSIEDVGKKNNSHFDYLTSLFTESPKYFYSDCIAELWAAIPEKVYEENEPFWLIRDNHKKQIEDAIVKGELEGIIEERIEGSKDDGFEAITDKNRIRKIEKGMLGNNFVVFTVYHDKFKDWLIKSNQWPLADDCLLKQWFEGEAVEDVGLVSHAGAVVTTTQPNANELDYSGLLKEPQRKDIWFRVIDDMTRAFYSENNCIPNEHQAWIRLYKTPPDNYGIESGKDKGGEDCLTMPTENPLSKSAFTKRWNKYTANKH